MGGEAGRAPSGGLRSCACSRTGWGRHHHHHHDTNQDTSRRHSNKQSQQNIPARSLLLSRQHRCRRHKSRYIQTSFQQTVQQNIPARSLLLSRQHRCRRHKSRYIQTSFQQTVPTEHSSQIIITVKTTPLQTTQIKIHPDVIPTNSPNRTFQPDHYYCQDNTAADDINQHTSRRHSNKQSQQNIPARSLLLSRQHRRRRHKSRYIQTSFQQTVPTEHSSQIIITVKTTPSQTTQIKIHPDVIPTNSPNRTFQPDHYYCQDNTAADDTNQDTSRRHSNIQSQQNIPARSSLLSRQHRRRRHKSRYIQTSFQQTVPTEHSSQIIITVKTTPLQMTQIKIHPDVIPTNSPNRTFQPDHHYCQDNTAADDTNQDTSRRHSNKQSQQNIPARSLLLSRQHRCRRHKSRYIQTSFQQTVPTEHSSQIIITVKTTPLQTTQIKIHPDVIPTNSPNRTFQPDHYYCQDNTAADDTNQDTSRRHSNKQSQQNIPARSLLLSRQHRCRRHKSRYIQTSFQQTVPTEHSSQIIITVSSCVTRSAMHRSPVMQWSGALEADCDV